MGRDFKGVVDVRTREARLFMGGRHGQDKVQTQVMPLEEAREILGDSLVDEVEEQLELVEMAGDEWSLEGFYAGEISPIFWGSAMTNFGVEPLLEFLADHAAPPAPRGPSTRRSS